MKDKKISINYDSFPNYRFKMEIIENFKNKFQINLEAYSYSDLEKTIFNESINISKEYFEDTLDDFLFLNLYKVKQDIEKNIVYTDLKSFAIEIESLGISISINGLSSSENYIMDRFYKIYKMFNVGIEYIWYVQSIIIAIIDGIFYRKLRWEYWNFTVI